MLLNFLSWTIVFFMLFSFGDIMLMIYNKICKQSEIYNPLDKLMLGLCSLVIPLSIWSLWLPSNDLFLSIALFTSMAYWTIFHKRAYRILKEIRSSIKDRFLPFESILIVLFILFSLYFFSWQQDVYDSAFYHYQNIRWNEEYAVVPGVANLDDRFGFNSNYFLLSAIFTFRFVLSEAIYPLQQLIVTGIGCWVLCELFVSKYDVKRIFILISYVLLFWVSIYFLGNTSTDILPNFIIFYIIARIVLYPDALKTRYILLFILPVFLVTCKMSIFPIGLTSFYLLYYLIKQRKYKVVIFLCTLSLVILIPWLIRNVIISGYLVYPLYQIDLFSFDWKVPREIAIKEKDYIGGIGYYFFRIALRYPHMSERDPLPINILTDIIYLLVVISLFFTLYYLWKRPRKVEVHLCLIYLISVSTIIIWAVGGPDIRFIVGVLCAVIFVGGILYFYEKKKYLPFVGKSLSFLFVLSLALWTTMRYCNFYQQTDILKVELTSHLLMKPYSVRDQQKANGIDVLKSFEIYQINNNQNIWVSPGLPYDMELPASIASHYAKFLPLECIEARGNSIQDGYRVKDRCVTNK
ncbi:hypothetical protein JGH11_19680 [Dysgonomonas sp. Marseille-P4677]|uniref:LIC_10190 family membrane protein n=1 Tax=Dysgonomonas sp. Marseille-P4677 TaxID=2364790 RepID=UPI00191268CE|nr:hypothetical protein [Dysgonomonas sp. Marseille-P4677]MBK5723092.1 hypothetical protein [Dysgonomonas sp. Marseille-P4677]